MTAGPARAGISSRRSPPATRGCAAQPIPSTPHAPAGSLLPDDNLPKAAVLPIPAAAALPALTGPLVYGAVAAAAPGAGAAHADSAAHAEHWHAYVGKAATGCGAAPRQAPKYFSASARTCARQPARVYACCCTYVSPIYLHVTVHSSVLSRLH